MARAKNGRNRLIIAVVLPILMEVYNYGIRRRETILL